MRALFACVLVLLLTGSALAAPYGVYDVSRVTLTQGPTEGQSIDLALARQMLADLQIHAGSYPPEFDSGPDQDRAKRDVMVLMDSLGRLADVAGTDQDLLLDAGTAHALGHNFNLYGAEDAATGYFNRLLALNPDHAVANHRLGVHLMNATAHSGLPYLKKAQSLGLVDATYNLAVAQILDGDRKGAQATLERYLTQRPDDRQAARYLKALREKVARITSLRYRYR